MRKPSHIPHWLRRKEIIALIVVCALAIWGIGSRLIDAHSLKRDTNEQAATIVSVITPKPNPEHEELVLPGNVEAWHQAPIYARTSGYLKDWKVGMGTPVKEGDLLAEIDSPEIDAQLKQAQADLATAQANNQLAQSTAERWKALLKTDSVAKQDADEKISDALAKAALVAAAKANYDRLNDLESFKRVTAPFDGVITSRTTDIGALINAGNNAGQQLFRIVQADRLRIYVQVPQAYAQAITPDLTATLTFAEHPGKSYEASLLKTADAIDPVTRTLLTEFKADNQNGELLAGGYAQVHMTLASQTANVRLPVNALLFRPTGTIAGVVDAQDKVHLTQVIIGRDFGNDVEITSGLTADDRVIINPPDSLSEGRPVTVAAPPPPKEEKKP